MRILVGLIAAGAALVAVPVAAQDVKAGVDAWARGDYRTAVEQWRGPAIAGDADAQYNLGQAYKLGRGVPVDPGLAESWFRKAALQGLPRAEDNYGLALYTSGRRAEALPWLEKSVARDEPRTELVLGTMLFNGDGVTRNYPRAYALMTRASQQGLQPASETLAQMDQYISPDDRQKGIGLAQQIAAAAPRPAAPGMSGGVDDRPARAVATAAVPPSRTPRDTAPVRTPRPVPAKPTPSPRSPAPAPAPAPREATPRGGAWRVQLGAFSSQGNAETQWARIRARLGGAQPAYVRAGRIVRLQAGGFASKAEAQRACTASGVSCVVVAP